jgi:(hydroxyamino)benzene mutase
VIETVSSADPMPAKEPNRHPLDPDPGRSTKATVVLVLGITAVLTGPLVGGVVPAVVGLVLAGQARADLADAHGYLTGADRIRRGKLLCWIGIVAAIAAIVAAIVIGILGLVNGAGQDFPSTSD